MSTLKTILVVDDDLDVRFAMAFLLQAEGYRVVTVANGWEALEYLKVGTRPDLILLDLAMPVMDGFRFRQLQRQDPNFARIPIIVISAAKEAESLGVAFFQKPIPLEDLLGLIRSYCGGSNGRPSLSQAPSVR
jgi:CheY-like chemotaxis protein